MTVLWGREDDGIWTMPLCASGAGVTRASSHTPTRMMPTVNFPPGYPALLRHHVPNGLPFPVETVLELPAIAYELKQRDDWWVVRVVATGEAVYHGPGSFEVFVSAALF